MKVAVLTVGTPDVVRAGLESILKSRRGVSVCARPGGGRKKDIIALLRTAKPDVTVVVVPALGTEAAVQAQALTALARKSSRVLVLLPGCDALGMRKVREAGAGGCVSLACSTDELFEALSSVNAGGRLPAGSGKGGAGEIAKLTRRERQVLQLLAEGKTTKESAVVLDVGRKTIETHRLNLMNKLQSHSVAWLTKLALREGLIPLDS